MSFIERQHKSAMSSFDKHVEAIGVGPFHYKALAILGIGNAADAVELLAIGYILPQLSESISDAQRGLLSAAVFFGMLCGGLLCGLFSDAFGRKPSLVGSLLITAVFGALSAAAPTVEWLIVTRILSGVGVGGSVPSVFTLAAEYLPAARRGFYITVVAWFWMIGSILTAGAAWFMLGYLELSWRWFALACAFPALLLVVLTLFYLPESPRFLYNQGEWHKTVAVLTRIARENDVAIEVSVTQMKEEFQTFVQAEVGSKRQSWKMITAQRWKGIRKMFRGGLKRTSVLLVIVWFALSFGWYGLILWIPTLFQNIGFEMNNYEAAFYVAAANLPGNIVSAVVMDKLGRKLVLAGSMMVASALAVLFAFSSARILVIIVASAFNGISIGGWNSLDCLSTESFPTEVRTSAMGLLAASGRLGSMAAQFVNGALITHSIALLLLITSGSMFVGAVAGLMLPKETTGTVLLDQVQESLYEPSEA